MMKNKLLGNTRGIATIIIVVVVVIIVAAAGVTAYVVLSNNNDKNTSPSDSGGGSGDSGGSGGGDTPASLNGPGLKANETLTYSISGSMKMDSAGESISAPLSGTVTIATKQLSNGDYSISITPNITYDLTALGLTSGTYNTPETYTVSSLDMASFDGNSIDLSSLTDTEYTPTEIDQINTLVDKYTSSNVTLSTPDGSLLVEKRDYTYGLNDLKLLIPDLSDMGYDMQYNTFNVTMSLWFGQDILYKAQVHLDSSMTISGVNGTVTMDGALTLTFHQT